MTSRRRDAIGILNFELAKSFALVIYITFKFGGDDTLRIILAKYRNF